jgi:hypothetical protein
MTDHEPSAFDQDLAADMADPTFRLKFEEETARIADATAWHATLTGADKANLDAWTGIATGTNSLGEKRTPFWDEAARLAAHPDYQRALEVIAVGLAPTDGVPVSDLAARVAAVGARHDANLGDLAGWASFALLVLGQEVLLGRLDGNREDLSDDDEQTLEDLRAWVEATERRNREEHGWP